MVDRPQGSAKDRPGPESRRGKGANLPGPALRGTRLEEAHQMIRLVGDHRVIHLEDPPNLRCSQGRVVSLYSPSPCSKMRTMVSPSVLT